MNPARSRVKFVFEASPVQAKNGSDSCPTPNAESFPKQTFGTTPAGAGVGFCHEYKHYYIYNYLIDMIK